MEVGEWAEYSVGAARGGSEGRQRGEAVRGGSRGGSEGRQWGQASRTYCCGEERWDIVATVALVGLGVTRALGPGNECSRGSARGGHQRTGGGVRLGAQCHGEVQRRLASGIGRSHLDVLLLEQQPHL